MKSFLLLALTVCSCTRVLAQMLDSVWTQADAADYVTRHNDSTTWDMELFAEDLAHESDTVWARSLKPALSPLPTPVPGYDWGYVSMRITELDIADKTILGATYAYAYDQYRHKPTEDSLAYYGTFFNIFVLTDTVGDNTRALMVNSRNAPHYLGTGKQLTSIGPVEFAQLSLASGENFAIVSQQYFDLRQGRTVLVAPLRDGSVRFLQLTDSPESMRSGAAGEEYNNAVIQAFQQQLEMDPRVIAFFTQAGTLE
ncbi:hypothetical protein [Neolewinella sp.]|uniref:hypothetical protein n=1 Tax=Neolewinella sp. TaxID=2993543 RepID=UPI003B524CDF